MSYKFSEHLQNTILNINNSNRMLAKEKQKEAEKAEHQKLLNEQQHQATEDDDLVEREALDFND
jgi:hypothetical protein|tara:strand:+ start:3228 stop:3419 length:192 start_codon:yes stop_codon:yes gene_type:complete